jgi:hypothetical protein
MISFADLAREALEGALRIAGVTLMVAAGLGYAAAWSGVSWLRQPAARAAGVLLGLGVIVSSGYVGHALQQWLRGTAR